MLATQTVGQLIYKPGKAAHVQWSKAETSQLKTRFEHSARTFFNPTCLDVLHYHGTCHPTRTFPSYDSFNIIGSPIEFTDQFKKAWGEATNFVIETVNPVKKLEKDYSRFHLRNPISQIEFLYDLDDSYGTFSSPRFPSIQSPPSLIYVTTPRTILEHYGIDLKKENHFPVYESHFVEKTWYGLFMKESDYFFITTEEKGWNWAVRPPHLEKFRGTLLGILETGYGNPAYLPSETTGYQPSQKPVSNITPTKSSKKEREWLMSTLKPTLSKYPEYFKLETEQVPEKTR